MVPGTTLYDTIAVFDQIPNSDADYVFGGKTSQGFYNHLRKLMMDYVKNLIDQIKEEEELEARNDDFANVEFVLQVSVVSTGLEADANINIYQRQKWNEQLGVVIDSFSTPNLSQPLSKIVELAQKQLTRRVKTAATLATLTEALSFLSADEHWMEKEEAGGLETFLTELSNTLQHLINRIQDQRQMFETL